MISKMTSAESGNSPPQTILDEAFQRLTFSMWFSERLKMNAVRISVFLFPFLCFICSPSCSGCEGTHAYDQFVKWIQVRLYLSVCRASAESGSWGQNPQSLRGYKPSQTNCRWTNSNPVNHTECKKQENNKNNKRQPEACFLSKSDSPTNYLI